MSSSLVTIALCLAAGSGPYGSWGGPAPVAGYPGPEFGGGGFGGGGFGGGGFGGGGFGGGGFGGGGFGGGTWAGARHDDQLYPYDAQEPWLHGYFQEMPAYGGYIYFRPYNYKQALAQSQTAGQWGMPPTMPYSQQFWQRYQDRASMKQRISQNEGSNYNSEYAKELARLRAWHDFQMQRQAAYPRGYPTATGSIPATAASQTAPAAMPKTIDPAAYQRLSRIEQLQQQLQRQTHQLQALQNALRQEQQVYQQKIRQGQ